MYRSMIWLFNLIFVLGLAVNTFAVPGFQMVKRSGMGGNPISLEFHCDRNNPVFVNKLVVCPTSF